ncbi:MAG: alkyldihydroxyacetonephosphate synthase [Chloroflexota bacterium]|jgi:alkyldihydroxyacetonephosphate synthase|nr:alkyldihydroxyacetonephosphate synthase [Chloroflexota bacterium]
MDVAALAKLLPGAELTTEAGVLENHAGDWSSISLLRAQRGALVLPAAVLRPKDASDVATALRWASSNGVAVVAGGGRSGVSGGVVTRGGELVIDMRSLDRVLDLDEVSGIVRVEAGILGTDLEAWLNARGRTLGHFPQSVALSTVGGWIAARSAGQLSSGYGAVEDFLVALTAALPDGTLATSRLAPRTAAGIQVHQLFLGSEGTLGVVTEAWLRVRHIATERSFVTLGFESFTAGLDAVRRMAQTRNLPDAIRVYDETDTSIAFRSLEPAPSGAVGIAVAEGERSDERIRRVTEIAAAREVEEDLAGHWWKHRNDAATTYKQVLSGELLGPDVAADTIEVAAIWSLVEPVYAAVREALARHSEAVGCHCSHAYETGCALYFTFVLRATDREAALAAAWHDALDAVLEAGGTMTHHHGVGQLKSAWLARELGGFAPYLGRVQRAFDPDGVMNPHTLRAK